MTSYSFSTATAIKLYIEISKGNVAVTAADTDTTTVEIEGDDPERFRVEQDGDEIRVVEPRPKGLSFRWGDGHDVSVTIPSGSQVRAKAAGADLALDGPLRALWVDSSSGDVEIDEVSDRTEINTASGDVRAERLSGPTRVKSGSGDIEVGELHGPGEINTASGDIRIGSARGLDSKTADGVLELSHTAGLHTKTASGVLEIGSAEGELRHSTASGDLYVKEFTAGSITVKGASADVEIGIPNGTPVWTDVSTVSGSLTSSIASTGAPAEGQPYVELRVSTASGDVTLVGL